MLANLGSDYWGHGLVMYLDPPELHQLSHSCEPAIGVPHMVAAEGITLLEPEAIGEHREGGPNDQSHTGGGWALPGVGQRSGFPGSQEPGLEGEWDLTQVLRKLLGQRKVTNAKARRDGRGGGWREEPSCSFPGSLLPPPTTQSLANWRGQAVEPSQGHSGCPIIVLTLYLPRNNNERVSIIFG